MKTFSELEAYASEHGMHVANLGEQPVWNAVADDDIDHFVCVLLGDYCPGMSATEYDMGEREMFERRDIWVSVLPVDATEPMGATFVQLDTDSQSWGELADMGEKESLELMG